MIKKFTFGQYRDKSSAIHQLDARIKIIYVIVLGILSFTIMAKADIFIFSLFVLMIAVLAKIGFRDLLSNLRPFYLIFVFLLAMYLIFSRDQIVLGLVYLWRFLMLIIISLLLTFTTKISDLIAAIEKLSKPLKILGIKPRNLAMMISVAVRFIPVMFVYFERVREAMISRLANLRKFRHMKVLVTLLLEKMMKSASNLSDSMYSRLYDENLESQRVMKLGPFDYISVLVVAFFIFIIY